MYVLLAPPTPTNMHCIFQPYCTFFQFFKWIMLSPSARVLSMLFPLPGTFFSQGHHPILNPPRQFRFILQVSYQLKCHFFQEAFLDHRYHLRYIVSLRAPEHPVLPQRQDSPHHIATAYSIAHLPLHTINMRKRGHLLGLRYPQWLALHVTGANKWREWNGKNINQVSR